MIVKVLVVVYLLVGALEARGVPAATEATQISNGDASPSTDEQDSMVVMLLSLMNDQSYFDGGELGISDEHATQSLEAEKSHHQDRRKRDTVVFRPLFATRERNAERLRRQQRWRNQQARSQARSHQTKNRPRDPYIRGKRDIPAFRPLFASTQRLENRVKRRQSWRRVPRTAESLSSSALIAETQNQNEEKNRSKRDVAFMPLFVSKEKHARKMARMRKYVENQRKYRFGHRL